MRKINNSKTKNKFLIKLAFMLTIILLVLPLTQGLPFFYEKETDGMYSSILDPRIPGWYKVDPWEVKWCMSKAVSDYVPTQQGGGSDFSSYGNVAGIYAYKTKIINEENPDELVYMYEISYFLMPTQEIEYKVKLGNKVVKEGIVTDFTGDSDYFIEYAPLDTNYNTVELSYSSIKIKADVIEKEESIYD
jgi:hypothetical protein